MMKIKLFPPACFLLAGILSTSAPLLAQAPANEGTGVGNPKALHEKHPNVQKQRPLEDVSRLLNLTPDQQTKARQIFDTAWNSARQLMPEMRQEHQQMKSLFMNSSAARFDADVDQLAVREGQLDAKMIEIHTKAMKDFYSMLTPEQKSKAADLYDLLTMRFPFHRQATPAGAFMHHGPNA
jgi:Spy/CpxP family protein refolding chaperone